LCILYIVGGYLWSSDETLQRSACRPDSSDRRLNGLCTELRKRRATARFNPITDAVGV
jgi:hypothetical protein